MEICTLSPSECVYNLTSFGSISVAIMGFNINIKQYNIAIHPLLDLTNLFVI